MGHHSDWNTEDIKQVTIEPEPIRVRDGFGVGQPVLNDEEIYLNGDADTDNDYETFWLSREVPEIDPTMQFCKTGERPYDKVVAAVLLLAKTIAPDAIDVESDEDMDGEDWHAARQLLAVADAIP